MTIAEFKKSIIHPDLPEGLSSELKALWYDVRGDWEQAHEIAQDIPGKTGAHIHAYLHRKEGDLWNAGYWYRNAGKAMPDKSLDDEWEDLVATYCNTDLL